MDAADREHLLVSCIGGRVLDEAVKGEAAEEPGRSSSGALASTSKRPRVEEPTLTSLHIQKALRQVLPGQPGQPLRPFLPGKAKLAWHLDKGSVRGLGKFTDTIAGERHSALRSMACAWSVAAAPQIINPLARRRSGRRRRAGPDRRGRRRPAMAAAPAFGGPADGRAGGGK